MTKDGLHNVYYEIDGDLPYRQVLSGWGVKSPSSLHAAALRAV